MKKLFLSLFLLINFFAFSQETFPTNGAKDNPNAIYAFANATIFKDYQTKLKNATLLIQNGRVVSVGTSVKIPKNAIQIDLQGQYIYPSFIDLYSDYGITLKNQKKPHYGARPVMLSKKQGAYHWNEAIHPEIDAVNYFSPDEKSAKELRNIGFGTVLTHNDDGIARGTGSLVLLSNGNENDIIIDDKASSNYSFKKGSSSQDNPGSQMGAIALLRQTYLDAEWYKNQQQKEEINLSLEAWNEQQKLPQIFEVSDKLEVLRANNIAQEFGRKYIVKGVGDEYQRLDDIKRTGSKLIIPMNFPKPYDVEDPFDAKIVKLSQMKHWELAPNNAKMLAENGMEFSITSADLKSKADFLKNLRLAVRRGLSEKDALKSLTYNPAMMIKLTEIGSLEKGKLANFIITSGNIFEDQTKIYQNWIKGEKYEVSKKVDESYFAEYKLTIENNIYKLVLDQKSYAIENKLIDKNTPEDSLKDKRVNVSAKVGGNLISMTIDVKSSKLLLSGYKTKDGFEGVANGDKKWKAEKVADLGKSEDKKEEKSETEKSEIGSITYPLIAFGWIEKPQQEEIIIKNTTVWTNEKEGVVKKDVQIKNGKIIAIGDNLASSTATIIDAKGKHLTSGIIDEHSHIAISKGVNEGTQASSAEVRIGDVVNSFDINIYRQIAGGVTAAQLLHGSANPIGGQSGIIKLRWGSTPDEMKINGADGFIKFALGENVKQSNWGEKHNIRFPQTRMGVEAVYYDHFWRAKDYEKSWKSYNSLSKKEKASAAKPRKDLELEALLEILNSKRFISCHSYMQHEINMLMHVADSMGFTVNTFTHILEGYKIADKMKKHGVGGSTFSDWWAYKYEVNDAIPYNAAIMHKMGITTAINSDDAEMGRRLNQEAAKTVKYGGLSEEDAWKTVTLNPAKLLHLDDRMGSVKVGKDADLVLWSDNPLSIYAKVEQTYIDGRKYYDINENERKEKWILEERERLIQKMIDAKKGGSPTQKPSTKEKNLYHCDHIGE